MHNINISNGNSLFISATIFVLVYIKFPLKKDDVYFKGSNFNKFSLGRTLLYASEKNVSHNRYKL